MASPLEAGIGQKSPISAAIFALLPAVDSPSSGDDTVAARSGWVRLGMSFLSPQVRRPEAACGGDSGGAKGGGFSAAVTAVEGTRGGDLGVYG